MDYILSFKSYILLILKCTFQHYGTTSFKSWFYTILLFHSVKKKNLWRAVIKKPEPWASLYSTKKLMYIEKLVENSMISVTACEIYFLSALSLSQRLVMILAHLSSKTECWNCTMLMIFWLIRNTRPLQQEMLLLIPISNCLHIIHSTSN